ncbi:phosphatidylserine decarboxylase [Helicobacter sp. 23-1046]
MNNFFSRLFGCFAHTRFPTPIQNFINSVYVAIFSIDLSEFESTSYPTLNALFTRKLKHNRIFDGSANVLISPSDSLITELGVSKEKKALQIKGMQYSVEELLGETLSKEMFYINLYLSPKDYHRYHAPCDLEIMELRYFGGDLMPVNMSSLHKNAHLFIRNERVVLKAKMPNQKILYFVAVGALNVGSIIFHCEPKIQTNARRYNETYAYASPKKVRKGEELGMFQMGSTIVLFIEDFTPSIKSAEEVKFAQSIGFLA